MRTTRLVLALAATAMAALGCYQPAGGSGAGVTRVRVEVFRNSTKYDALEAEMTQAVKSRVEAEPGLELVDSSPDATIKGDITSYIRDPLVEGKDDNPIEYRIIITAFVKYMDAAGGQLAPSCRLTNIRKHSQSGTYKVLSGQAESAARVQAVGDLAEAIVKKLTERW